MLDIVMLALGLGFFVAGICYAYARGRLYENDHDLRLFTRRARLRRSAVLPDLRAAASRAVLTAFWHRPRAHPKAYPHDRHRLDSNFSVLRNRRRAGQAARLVHDARLHWRAHVPVADPAPGRGRVLLAPRRRRKKRGGPADPQRAPCCCFMSAAFSSSMS